VNNGIVPPWAVAVQQSETGLFGAQQGIGNDTEKGFLLLSVIFQFSYIIMHFFSKCISRNYFKRQRVLVR
jgi:hypothetical protein